MSTMVRTASFLPPPPSGRILGRLLPLRNSGHGFGFLYTGRGKPEYFIHRTSVPAEAWVDGQLFEFSPLPPKPGTHSPRAGDPRPVRPDPEDEVES